MPHSFAYDARIESDAAGVSPNRLPGSGLRDFDGDVALLTGVLNDVICRGAGEAVIELRDRTVSLAQATRSGDPSAPDTLASLVSELDLDQIELLVRSLSRKTQVGFVAV